MHENLYNMMKYFHTLCKNHCIEYWSDGGTTLGMIREKGIIQHDDDLDVGIFDTEVDKIVNLIPVLNKAGYTIDQGKKSKPDIIKFYKYDQQAKKPIKYYWIDIIIFEKKKSKKKDRVIVRPKAKEHRRLWPKEYFYPDELFPLKIYKFGDIEIYGPKKAIVYLERQYGKNWTKPKIDGAHSRESFL